MVSRPADLPDYERPPLVEVVLAAQFAQLQGYRTVHAGLLWEEKFRKNYPRAVEQLPLGSTFEVFGPQAQAAQIQIKGMPGPPVPRLWFMNSQESELVQIQADRFVRNWSGEGENYPRYEKLQQSFLQDLTEIDEFFKRWRIGSIQTNQCEITYVNRIRLEGQDLRTDPGLALKIFTPAGFAPAGMDASSVKPEDCNSSLRYVLKDSHGEPRGRLHITVQSWPGEPDLRLDLTVRGAPVTPAFEAAADFLNEGRRVIVQSFTALTRERMHEKWGRVK